MHRRSFRHVLMAAAAAVAGLVVVTGTGGTADAATVNQSLDCGIGGTQTSTLETTAPATVPRGDSFTVTLAPSGPAGKADGAEIKNMVTTFVAPAGSSIVGGSAVTSGGSGTLGAVSTTISGNTIQLKVPGPIANGASFVNPTLSFDLTATGVAGTNLSVKFKQSGGYTLTAAGSFNVSCDASPQASLTTTQITSNETTTTTGVTTTAGSGTTSTTQPQPVVSYEEWSPDASCGTVQTTTAPENVESVTITALGAAGGRGGGQGGGGTSDAGSGGSIVSTFPATAGQTFAAVVGCAGANGGSHSNSGHPDGYSDGGGTGRGSVIAGITGASGGQGGGSTAVCTTAACKAEDFNSAPIVVAGGGGGGGVSNCAGTPAGRGGNGGNASSTALGGGQGPSGANGAQGGNSGGSTGGGGAGAGGVNSNGGSGNGGSAPNGSGGAGLNVVGGGGGGGYIGGGAGGNSNTGCKGGGGGGGGSSWAGNAGTSTTFGSATEAAGVVLRFKVVVDPEPCGVDVVPFDDADDLVGQQYQDFEGRAPTFAEQDLWIGGINRCEESADELIVSLLETDQTLDEARLVRLYIAFFKRPPDPSGYAFWQSRLDAGYGLIRAADHFANSSEFIRTYGSLSNEDFIELVYENVLGRPSDPTGKAFWLNRLNNRTANRGTVMINFSESSENTRERTEEVQVFRMFRGMRGRFPSGTEFWALVDPINDDGKTLADAANAIRTSTAYADRVNP